MTGDGMNEARLIDERRIVELFATHGAEKMAKRRHHGRWLEEPREELLQATAVELGELFGADTREEAIAECVDVALTAMMLADKLMQEEG